MQNRVLTDRLHFHTDINKQLHFKL